MARIAIAAAVIGVVLPWISAGPVRLDGLQGPNNGWLVLIVAALALAWVRSMARGSVVGLLGVLGAAIVICWTAIANWLDSRHVLGAQASYGLLLVAAAGVALAAPTVAAMGRRLALRRQAASADVSAPDGGSRG